MIIIIMLTQVKYNDSDNDQVAVKKMKALMAFPRVLKANTIKTLKVYDGHDDYDHEGDTKNNDYFSKVISHDLSPKSESRP